MNKRFFIVEDDASRYWVVASDSMVMDGKDHARQIMRECWGDPDRSFADAEAADEIKWTEITESEAMSMKLIDEGRLVARLHEMSPGFCCGKEL